MGFFSDLTENVKEFSKKYRKEIGGAAGGIISGRSPGSVLSDFFGPDSDTGNATTGVQTVRAGIPPMLLIGGIGLLAVVLLWKRRG